MSPVYVTHIQMYNDIYRYIQIDRYVYGMVWYAMVWYGMVCMCVCMYIYICTYTYTFTFIDSDIDIHMHIHRYTYVHHGEDLGYQSTLKTHKSFTNFAFQENPNVATNVSMAARPLGSKLCEAQGLSLLRFSETVFLVPSGWIPSSLLVGGSPRFSQL